MSRKSVFYSFSVFILMLTAVSFAFAQGTTSRVTGTVTDNTGAVVPNATVTLVNEGTRQSLNTQTSDKGTYSFDLIPVGTYTVTVEKEGFKKFVSTGNNVNVNLPTTVNVPLEVGEMSVTVTVEGTADAVQTGTSGNVGTTIEQRTIESLPIVGTRGRNPLSLINFTPGVTVGANTGGGVHVHGSRDRAFNFTLDGIDINESTAGGSNFTPLRTNPDSIQEFQILTSNFTAEQGRSSGAQVSLVTRSGTNRFTGSVFEYYQTPGLNANEYENNLNNLPKRKFVQHIFGGSVGGPIIKDRFFFFTNLQFLRASETRSVTSNVFTAQARQGLFRYVVGGRNNPAGVSGASVDASGNPLLPNCGGTVTTNCIATYNIANNPSGVGIDSRLGQIINAMPQPNNFFVGDGLNTAGFSFTAPQIEKQYDLVMKFDYKFADNNLLYVRWAQGEQNTIGDAVNGGLRRFPDTSDRINTYRTPKNLAINHRWSPTARFTNEFIFGINKFEFSFENPDPKADIPFAFNLLTTPFSNFTYNARSARTYQFVDNLTFDFSPHVIKAGINFRFGRQEDDRSSVGGTDITPIVNFSATVNSNFNAFNLPSTGINTNDLARLRSAINDLLGRVGSFSQAFVADPGGSQFQPAGTRWNFIHTYPEFDFYVQDTWRARQNLTVDLGLRYEIKLSPDSENYPVLRPSQPITVDSAPSNALRWEEGKLFENDLNNFSPSVGFAWDPFKSGKTSIRANYRLSYDRFPSFVFGSSIFQNTPGNNIGVFNSSFGQGGGLLRQGLPSLTPASPPNVLRQPSSFGTGSVTVVDPDLQYAEIHSWFAGFQREIWAKNVLEINYIGKRGTSLFGGYDANQVNINATAAGFNTTFLQEFNAIRANPSYNSEFINALYTGSRTTNSGTATFRSTNTTAISQGSVAAAAASVSSRILSGQQMIAANGFSPFLFQRYPQFSGAVNVLDSNDYSLYNALELIMRRRISDGIGYQLGYTLSKSEDTRSFDPTFTTVSRANAQSASSTPFNINDRDLNYAWSDFDRRHVFQGFFVAELPFGKGRRFFSGIPTALDWVIGGWQLSGTLLAASGRPFTVYSGVNTFSNAVQTPVNCNGCPRNLGSLIQESGTNFWFSEQQRAQFTIPAPGEFSNTGRNYFIGPRQFQIDASLAKKFRFTERISFDLRVDAQNLTNTVNFGLPTATFTSSTFGQIRDNTTTFSRRIQLSGKLNF